MKRQKAKKQKWDEKLPTEYDVFNIVSWLNEKGEKNIARREERASLYSVADLPAWGSPFRFRVTTLVSCLRQAGYEALEETRLRETLASWRYTQRGRYGHYRFKSEMRGIYQAYESFLIDPKYHITGYSDYLAYTRDLKELMVVDLKTKNQFAFRQIKRENVRKYLMKTKFYPPSPEDELQVMLYIYLYRGWGIPIRFGVIVYENEADTNQRKVSLVEYDEKAVKLFLEKVRELENLVKRGKLPEPYLPKNLWVHTYCPYRLKCPRGQEAMAVKKKKRNIPIWKLLQIKKAKQELERLPPAQLSLLEE